jgi:hypothetical protein
VGLRVSHDRHRRAADTAFLRERKTHNFGLNKAMSPYCVWATDVDVSATVIGRK